MKKSDFDKLKKLWYKKLEKDGFQDIEQDEEYFKGRMTSDINPKSVASGWREQAEYYQLCTYFLNDHGFSSKIEHIIWEYHTNGISYRDITDILNKVRKKKINRMTVWRTIHRLETLMKDKYLVK